jgi:excisionase family DNA binding protein
MSRLLRPDQVADRLCISKRSAYRLINQGAFSALKVGCSLRVMESSVDAYVRRQIEIHAIETGIISKTATGAP